MKEKKKNSEKIRDLNLIRRTNDLYYRDYRDSIYCLLDKRNQQECRQVMIKYGEKHLKSTDSSSRILASELLQVPETSLPVVSRRWDRHF